MLDTADLSINQASATAQLINADSDVHTDLVVSRPDGLLDIYLAGADGMFTLQGPDNRAAALLTWQSFLAQLRKGSVEGALP